jgi:hypothetical protein
MDMDYVLFGSMRRIFEDSDDCSGDANWFIQTMFLALPENSIFFRTAKIDSPKRRESPSQLSSKSLASEKRSAQGTIPSAGLRFKAHRWKYRSMGEHFALYRFTRIPQTARV